MRVEDRRGCCERRGIKPLETTGELSEIVRASIPAKMREKGTALYDDFAQAMKQATDSFRSANEAYSSVKR